MAHNGYIRTVIQMISLPGYDRQTLADHSGCWCGAWSHDCPRPELALDAVAALEGAVRQAAWVRAIRRSRCAPGQRTARKALVGRTGGIVRASLGLRPSYQTTVHAYPGSGGGSRSGSERDAASGIPLPKPLQHAFRLALTLHALPIVDHRVVP